MAMTQSFPFSRAECITTFASSRFASFSYCIFVTFQLQPYTIRGCISILKGYPSIYSQNRRQDMALEPHTFQQHINTCSSPLAARVHRVIRYSFLTRLQDAVAKFHFSFVCR